MSFALFVRRSTNRVSNTSTLVYEVIREDNKFTGNGSLSIDGNTCTYTVTNTGGQTREVRGTGNAIPARRKVKALVSKIKPAITLSSSQEVPDF